VHIRTDKVDAGGMGIDFLEIEEFLKKLLPDYVLLNDIVDFSPSAENMAKWIYERVKEKFPTVSKVLVWEKEDCGAEYWEG